ncbi:MAG: hypothetical protein AABX88_02595 [Nanoarchaeota archaeon]
MLKKYEDMMVASAFAEAGEYETARGILKEVQHQKRTRLNLFEKMMAIVNFVENRRVAITFAEAGEYETAREIMRKEQRPQIRNYIRPQIRLRA